MYNLDLSIVHVYGKLGTCCSVFLSVIAHSRCYINSFIVNTFEVRIYFLHLWTLASVEPGEDTFVCSVCDERKIIKP